MVLGDAEGEVAGFEGGVAEFLEGGGDLDDLLAFPLVVGGLLILGVVFVGVAGDVGDFLRRLVVVVAGQLAAV